MLRTFPTWATNSLNRVSSGDEAEGDDLFHEPEHSAEKRPALQPPPEATVRDHHPMTGALQEIQATKVRVG
jgi:hypothetical protein